MNNGLSPIEDSPVERPTQQFQEPPRSTPSPAAAGTAIHKVRSFSRPRSPNEMPTEPLPSRTPPPRTTTPRSAGGHVRSGSESYYEDVDPRFADSDPMPANAGLPTALQAGFNRSSPVSDDRNLLPSQSGPAPTGRLPTPPSRPGTAPSGNSRSRQDSTGNNDYPQAFITPPIDFNNNGDATNDRMGGLGAMGAVGGLLSDSSGVGRGLGPMAEHANPSTSNATTAGSIGLTTNGLRSNAGYNDGPYAASSLKPSSDAIPERDDPSYETLPSGSRSPAAGSDISQFTSISQRGVNPNWRPPPGSMPAYDGTGYGGPSPEPGAAPSMTGYGGPPMYGNAPAARSRANRPEDLLLANAPDFSIPGVGPAGRGARGGLRGGGGMMGRGAPIGIQTAASQGRYPREI